MNYFILLSIFLFITTVVMSILWLKERRMKALIIEEAKSIKHDNETLREAFINVSDTAAKNRELYINTLELYNLASSALQETQEDLDYAKAIINGDLSHI